jgi:hypothetical protein
LCPGRFARQQKQGGQLQERFHRPDTGRLADGCEDNKVSNPVSLSGAAILTPFFESTRKKTGFAL